MVRMAAVESRVIFRALRRLAPRHFRESGVDGDERTGPLDHNRLRAPRPVFVRAIVREPPLAVTILRGRSPMPELVEVELKAELRALDELLGDTRARHHRRQTPLSASEQLIAIDREIRDARVKPL